MISTKKESEVAQSCPTLCNPMDCSPPSSSPRNSPGRNTGVGSHSLLQGIFPNQGSNLGLLHCGQTLYPLSHQGSLYTFLGRKIIKALPIGKDQVHKYVHSCGNPPKSTDRQAFLWAHPCLQKTHQKLFSLVCEAFIQNRS